VIEQRKSLGVVLEHWEVSYCVFEQLVIWYYILVKLSLEVQGGQDYFRFVEGTCIISCVLSFSALLLSVRCIKTLNSSQTLNTIRLWPWEQFSYRKKEKFLKTQFNPPPPFLCFFSPSISSILVNFRTSSSNNLKPLASFDDVVLLSSYFLVEDSWFIASLEYVKAPMLACVSSLHSLLILCVKTSFFTPWIDSFISESYHKSLWLCLNWFMTYVKIFTLVYHKNAWIVSSYVSDLLWIDSP